MGSVIIIYLLLLLVKFNYVSASVKCCPEGQALLLKKDVCWEPKTNVTSKISLACNLTLRFLKSYYVNDADEVKLHLGDDFDETLDGESQQSVPVDGIEGVLNINLEDDLNLTGIQKTGKGMYGSLTTPSGAKAKLKGMELIDPFHGRDCREFREEYDRAVDCPYGIHNWVLNGCNRWKCKEDPCVRLNCSTSEHCERIERIKPTSQGDWYSAMCAPGPDCMPFQKECYRLQHCEFGIEKVNGTDDCEKCNCKQNPCKSKSCAEGQRCVLLKSMPMNDQEPLLYAECNNMVKAGACPVEDTSPHNDTCPRECDDDADCRGVGKCCRRGCSHLCLSPVTLTSILQTPAFVPGVPAAPVALPQHEPEVVTSEGGTTTLPCLFYGNPPPKITWRFGELTIDGNSGRYRLTSDDALEIVSLYRNDTGVYICAADNGFGVAMQEIRLIVTDPVRVPVGIVGDENVVVIGELGEPLSVHCLAYGYPSPSVFWYFGYERNMVPYYNEVYEARGNVLHFRSLAIETLELYTCHAYNGEDKAASWSVIVKAYRPDEFLIENEFLVPRKTSAPRPRTQPPTITEMTTTTPTTNEATILFTVPVSTHVSAPSSTLNIGADLRLTCEVDGFPEPDVHWTKDGANIQTLGRITITSSTIVSRLTVTRVSIADSGLYACHASNPYSSQSDTVQIKVQQLVVPATCTDDPYFANCSLIVRSKFCSHKYYSKWCCKSCVDDGQLNPHEAELQADQPMKKK